MIAEGDSAGIDSAVRELVGEGETIDRERETGRLALMPYLTALALVPLGFVLLRRNLRAERRGRRPAPAAVAQPSRAPAAAVMPAEQRE